MPGRTPFKARTAAMDNGKLWKGGPTGGIMRPDRRRLLLFRHLYSFLQWFPGIVCLLGRNGNILFANRHLRECLKGSWTEGPETILPQGVGLDDIPDPSRGEPGEASREWIRALEGRKYRMRLLAYEENGCRAFLVLGVEEDGPEDRAGALRETCAAVERQVRERGAMRQRDGEEARLRELEAQVRYLREDQDNLLESRDRYAELFESAPVGYVDFDVKGRALRLNGAVEEMVGLDRGSLRGNHFVSCVLLEDRSRFYAHLRRCRETTRQVSTELTLSGLGREPVRVEIVSVLFRDVEEQIIIRSVIVDVTERRRMEEALRKSHEELEERVRERTAELVASNEQFRTVQRQQRALLDSIPDIAWLKDRESRFIAVNRPFGEACGLDPAALPGRTDLDIWPPDLAERYRADDRKVVESGAMRRIEEPLVDSQGQRSWIETIKVPILDERGHVVGTAGIARDITERRRAEERLRETTETLRAIVEESPLAVIVLDRDGKVLLWNPAAVRTFGWREEEVLGRPVPAVPEDRRELFGELLRRAFEGERHSDLEARGLRKDGSLVNLLVSTAPLRDAQGTIYGNLGVFTDITRRKRAEEKLREATRTLEELVQASPAGVFVLDPEGKVLLWNPAMEKILGWTEEEVRGKLFPAVTEGQEEARENLEHVLAGNAIAGAEIRRRRKDGQPVDLHFYTAPIRDESGGLRSIMGIIMDVTQLREMEHIAMVQAKMVSLGQMAAGIAHQIRNPLSGLNLYLSILERTASGAEEAPGELREDLRRLLPQMKGSSAKIDEVIRSIMDFSRPEPLRRILMDVNLAIREAVGLSRPLLQKSGVMLEAGLGEEPQECHGDLRLLEQVMLNLITNAVQAMEAQKGEKRILIDCRREDSFIVIRVSDSGPGVPAENRDRIFDPYFTTRSGGTGIGLSLSHRIVKEHGGYLDVGAGPLGGAEFRIGIPRRQ